MGDDDGRRLTERLEAAGRGLDPAPDAWVRARARAFAGQSRPSHARGFTFAAATVALMIMCGAAAYASPPDSPLFPLQRGIDGTLLALPLPKDLHARAQVSVGERRIVQAAEVSSRAPTAVVSDLLEEGSAHYGRARSAASTLGAAARAPVFRDLARSERSAAGALQHSGPPASSEIQQLLQRHEDELNDGAHDDEQRGENDGEQGNNE
jgi:hypothetical protein